MTNYRAELQRLVQAYDEHGGLDSSTAVVLHQAVEEARTALAQSEPEGNQVCCMVNCHWDGPPPSPHASVSDWFEQEGSKGILYGLRISALPSRNEVPHHALPLPQQPS